MGNPPLSLQSSLSARRRRPKILLLDIDQFLADTMLMDPLEVGIYMRLLTHIWLNGHLPEDRKILARIAQVKSEDKHAWSIAWSIAQSIAQASSQVQQVREEWMAKRQKAHEKAIKAAQARWEKYRQTKSEKADAPSITPSMQASMQKEGFPHTPFQEASSVPGDRNPGFFPPDPPRGGQGETQAKEEVMAKPVRIDSLGTAGNREDVTLHRSATASTYPARNSSAGHFKNSVNADSASSNDGRWKTFLAELERYWEQQNPDHQKLPWSNADRQAMRTLLEGNPDLRFEQFQSILRNRAQSDDVNPLEPPSLWLATAIRWREGPLDRFMKPKKAARMY